MSLARWSSPAIAAALFAATLVAALAQTSACSRPIPEEGTPDAQLYREFCGTNCHGAYQPHSLTPAMWKLQVERMDQKFRGASLPPPQGMERERLMNYLLRNAGG